MVKDELKYRHVVAAGFDLVLGRFPSLGGEALGKLIAREASSATIFLVNSEAYAQEIFRAKLNEGAEYSIDFDLRDVIAEAAEQMIEDIPLYHMRPYEIAEVAEPFSPWGYRFRSNTIFDVSTAVKVDTPRILTRIGGRLRDAELFTARAHSLLEIDDYIDVSGGCDTTPYLRTRLLRGALLRRPFAGARIFDKDHAASVEVLNESVDALQRIRLGPEMTYEQLVREEDSRTIDALQAADIAAGFARDILDRKGLRALAAQFRKVILNGTNLDQLKGFN